MPMPLEKWQERLERHFKSLARARADSGFPIFGLEHGLTDEELEEISSLLQSHLKQGLRLSPHWLLWVVYATERGYSYTGDEYWRSFEEQTPGWELSDRYRIVPWFTNFHKAYNGVVPSGPWATQFRIIAWPITHAILPRYLQFQFARALYDLRFRLAGLDTVKLSAIGRLLAATAHHAPNRFKEFLQQEELTGRIVLGLFGEAPAEGREPIYPPTLRRIVGDLEKVQSSREWLKEAQRIVNDRFKCIGRGAGRPGPLPRTEPDGRPSAADAHMGIRPRLLLRYAGAATWSVVMEVASFRNVAALNADIQTFIRRTRCHLNGTNDMKPAGWLLSGNAKGVLKSWPDPRKPLIQFERSHEIVDHLIEECHMTSGPVWLFRIASDGTAREITGRIVRPSYSYIVLTTGDLPEPRACMNLCSVDCSGIKSFRLLMPADVSTEDTAWLQKLGLQVTRTIRVWPAGLPCRCLDGEGNSEWLTTEAPCFGIIHDHPIDAYAFRLDNGPETVIYANGVGNPVFVRLAPLPVGTYSLTVKARRSPTLDSIAPSPPAEGLIQLTVREPDAWFHRSLSHPGLIVTLDPDDSNLDTFWKNEVSLSVLGPESHSVTITVSLEGRDGQQIISEQLGGPMELPVTTGAWRKRFAQFVEREEIAERYLEASIGYLSIRGEELGEYLARFEHEVLPLRFVLKRNHGNIVLRLIDDTGKEGAQPTNSFFSMETPADERTIEPNELLKGITVVPPGGLFIAMHDEYQDSIVVSTGLTSVGLQGLGVTPHFDRTRGRFITLARTFEVFEWWLNARGAGFLVDIRRRQVTDWILQKFYGSICGADWGKAESDFLADLGSQRAMENLKRLVCRHKGFAIVLSRDYQRMCNDPASGSQWYAELATKFGISTDRELCKFSLRLASQPHQLSRVFRNELNGLLSRIGNCPTLLRGARLLALLCANPNRKEPTVLLPRWRW